MSGNRSLTTRAGIPRTDERWMYRALAYARRGSGTVFPNPLVGAVIVRDNTCVGFGWHAQAGGAHAEIEAITQAGDLARGATMYVTLEPCNHFGRTPPCTESLVQAGIQRVVVGMRDPNPRVKGGGVEWLREAGVHVDVGTLRQECEEVNQTWLHAVRTALPFVALKLAVSLDGKIAYADKQQRWISGTIARAQVHRMRRHCDAVMVGANTVLIDDPLLTNRSGRGKQPLRVVVDSQLRVPPTAKIFSPLALGQAGPTPSALVATTSRASYEARKALELAGVEVVVLDGTDGSVDLKSLLQFLAHRGIQAVLCEGGAALATSLMKERLCQRVIFYQAPVIIGPEGRPFFEDMRSDGEQAVPVLNLLKSRPVGRDVLSIYSLL